MAEIVELCDAYFSTANAQERDRKVTEIVQKYSQIMDSIESALEHTRYTAIPAGRVVETIGGRSDGGSGAAHDRN